jgi:steroid 5-alpha reductase family enzyme
MPWIYMILAATAFVVVEMAVTHSVARRLRNNSIVDVVWSAGFLFLGVIYLVTAPQLPDGSSLNTSRALLLLMILIWSGRLAAHLFFRVTRHHPKEDIRYAQLRQEWGASVDRRMFGFFQLQGAIQLVLSLPWLLVFGDVSANRNVQALSWFEIAGASLWLVGLLGETLADRQLARFRKDTANVGRVCQVGLWNYSRHPNYFFEWLIWVAFFLFACGSPWGWISLIAPALMWHFLVHVTGIPMTEELSVRSKGDAYRAYQRSTSAFIPWFKRSHPMP